MHKKDELYQYQKQVVEEIKRRDRLACFLDMGLGKTIISLTACADLLEQKQIKAVLVVAPKSVVNVWETERASWEHTSHLRVSAIEGSAQKRLQRAETDADVYVVGRDNFAWLSGQIERLAGGCSEADMLILDESTSFKNRSTLRWKSLCQKGKRKQPLLKRFHRRLLLTGTPCSESYEGLFGQIYILDEGERLGKSITKFRETYMIPDIIHNRVIYHRFYRDAIPQIDAKIKDICISMKSEDYLQLPDKIDIVRWTGYRPDATYEAMRKDGVVTVGDDTILAPDPAVRYGKLRQIASGFIYTEQHEARWLHNHKKTAFAELLEELDGHNVLVFYQFDCEREWLQKEFRAELVDTPEQQARWNAGKIRVAVANPSSIGYGVNLQKGGTIIVFYTCPLSYEQYAQSVKRIHRNGVVGSVVKVIHLLAKGTIEETVYKLLKEQKADLLRSLMDAMKI